MEKIQEIVAAGTAVKKAGTIAESVPPPPSRAMKFSTDESVMSYTVKVSDKHLLT